MVVIQVLVIIDLQCTHLHRDQPNPSERTANLLRPERVREGHLTVDDTNYEEHL
jgi:hypothetical protein